MPFGILRTRHSTYLRIDRFLESIYRFASFQVGSTGVRTGALLLTKRNLLSTLRYTYGYTSSPSIRRRSFSIIPLPSLAFGPSPLHVPFLGFRSRMCINYFLPNFDFFFFFFSLRFSDILLFRLVRVGICCGWLHFSWVWDKLRVAGISNTSMVGLRRRKGSSSSVRSLSS